MLTLFITIHGYFTHDYLSTLEHIQ